MLSALLWAAQNVAAQNVDTLSTDDNAPSLDETSFTFSESQLGEDDNVSLNSTVLNASNNVYSSNAGMKFGAVNYRFRAFDNKYNEVYINGVLMNDPERGNFSFKQVGGLNNITKNADFSLPFESNNFGFAGIAGSCNYNFRPSAVPQGHKVSASLANRSYVARAMYTYGSGVTPTGWSFAGSVSARYAGINGFANMEGQFYNSLAYYLGAEKIVNDANTISLVTFANPQMNGSRGAATDETYWLADSHYYNSYLGYYDGEKRNSRVARSFAPTTLLTWDFKPSTNLQIASSLYALYSLYSTTKLQYNNAANPAPDYWKNLPSSNFNVWDSSDLSNRDEQNLADWNTSYNYWTSKDEHRYIDFDRLCYANLGASALGIDAKYYLSQVHTDRIQVGANSNLRYKLNDWSHINAGIHVNRNKSNHYQTVFDMLGASLLHNVNSYAIGTYSRSDYQVQYDMLNYDGLVGEGDRLGYDYNIFVDKIMAWAGYTMDRGIVHAYVTGKFGYTDMFREGKMQNGLDPNNSYGSSDKAKFEDGGVKLGASFNLGAGNAIDLGFGYEANAPEASTAFASPEINNDFVKGLVCENILSSQLSYAFSSPYFRLNLTGYYNKVSDATKWTCFYYDDINAFSYVSMTGIEKEYYGVELGAKVRLTSWLDAVLLGNYSEAKYVDNCNVLYMNSNDVSYSQDVCMSDGMREDGTPLSIASIGLSYHRKSWFAELTGTYYDRIYLSFSPTLRYQNSLKNAGLISDDGEYLVPDQAKGNGGFMLDASVGRNIRLKKGSMYVGLMVGNLLNNNTICTGGYEQSRSDYTIGTDGSTNARVYKFSMNPKKYYAWNINGMLNVIYKF